MTTEEIESLWCLEVRPGEPGQKDSVKVTPLAEAVRRNGREILSRRGTENAENAENTRWTIVGVAGSYEVARGLERMWKRKRGTEDRGQRTDAEHHAERPKGAIA
jgi:hypothetical protein